MIKELINHISSELKIKNKSLLEKDIILHKLLYELLGNEYFKDNFVFKGGTCLIKCYYGYYRFSEDLDFSWIDQKKFEDKSQTQIRKILSKEINKFTSILEDITKNNNLDFKADKTDSNYIEFGGSNKFVTFKLKYKSVVQDEELFIKIQINYVESFKYSFKIKEAKTISVNIKKKDIEFLFPDDAKYLLINPKIRCYNIKEILIEKVRAILTRRGVKARDFIDVFLILKREKIDLKSMKPKILEKIKFMLQYDKYIKNLKDFKLEKFVLGEEEKLLLMPIEDGFEKFLKEFHKFLNEIYEELK